MLLSNAEINQKLNSILTELGHEKYLVNPYFRISKATPEQMYKYRDLKYRFQRSRILFYLLVSIPINISKIFLFTILSFIFMNQNRIFSKLIDQAEFIFLSHGIGENISQKGTDQFFGVMPTYLSGRKRSVAMIYTNHYRISYKKYLKLTLLTNDGINRNLIPKFLKPTENLSYLKTIVPTSFTCLIKGVKIFKTDPVSAYLLIKGSILFYGRATYSNFLLMKRVELGIDRSKPKYIVLTFEGHSYEQYLIENVSRSYPEINLVLYQHSPIVPDHYGVKSFLRSYKNQIVIMTTGNKYIDIFTEISPIPIYKLVGSSKALKSESEVSRDPGNIALFAPEGTMSATSEYLKLIRYLCDRMPTFNFRLRLHPNLKRGVLINIQIRLLNFKHNFSLSSSNLYSDLEECKYVFYRSSAVGIESLPFNATPIFYGNLGESDLDVLRYSLVNQPLLNTPNKILVFLNLNTLPLSKNVKMKIYTELFEQVKYSELNEIFNVS
jgi:hypothetical protein